MAVTLDIGNLPYSRAIKIIDWCYKNNINRSRCEDIFFQWSTPSSKWSAESDWTIEIPEEIETWLVLKFS